MQSAKSTGSMLSDAEMEEFNVAQAVEEQATDALTIATKRVTLAKEAVDLAGRRLNLEKKDTPVAAFLNGSSAPNAMMHSSGGPHGAAAAAAVNGASLAPIAVEEKMALSIKVKKIFDDEKAQTDAELKAAEAAKKAATEALERATEARILAGLPTTLKDIMSRVNAKLADLEKRAKAEEKTEAAEAAKAEATAKAAGAEAPEAKAPEAKAPEAKAPEAKASEAKAASALVNTRPMQQAYEAMKKLHDVVRTASQDYHGYCTYSDNDLRPSPCIGDLNEFKRRVNQEITASQKALERHRGALGNDWVFNIRNGLIHAGKTIATLGGYAAYNRWWGQEKAFFPSIPKPNTASHQLAIELRKATIATTATTALGKDADAVSASSTANRPATPPRLGGSGGDSP